MEDKKIKNLKELSTSTPDKQQGELFEKLTFADEPIKPSERTVSEDTPSVNLPLPENLDQRIVFDEEYAAKKTATEVTSAPNSTTMDTPAPAPSNSSSERTHTAQRTNTAPRSRSASPAPHRKWKMNEHLCSGETPSDAAQRIAHEFGALMLFSLILCLWFLGKNIVVNFLSDNAYNTISQSISYSEGISCGEVPIQKSDLPNGYAAAQAVCTKLGSPIADKNLFVKSEEDSLFPSDIFTCMESGLPNNRIQLKKGLSNYDLLIEIHDSLLDGSPVIVLLSEPSKKDTALQYAVVTAMDAQNDQITLEFPDTGTKVYTLDKFIEATRFENYKDMPFKTKAGLFFGSLSRNTAIFVE